VDAGTGEEDDDALGGRRVGTRSRNVGIISRYCYCRHSRHPSFFGAAGGGGGGDSDGEDGGGPGDEYDDDDGKSI
jgi:hypothetical protein